MAISRPSEETATASVTPAVLSTKLLSSQLKLRASSLRLIAPPPTYRRPGAGPRRQEHCARGSLALRARSFTLLGILGILGMPLDLVQASLHPGGEAGQKAVHIPGRAVIMPRTAGSVPVTAAVAVAAARGGGHERDHIPRRRHRPGDPRRSVAARAAPGSAAARRARGGSSRWRSGSPPGAQWAGHAVHVRDQWRRGSRTAPAGVAARSPERWGPGAAVPPEGHRPDR